MLAEEEQPRGSCELSALDAHSLSVSWLKRHSVGGVTS
jgi:hypothetical protein